MVAYCRTYTRTNTKAGHVLFLVFRMKDALSDDRGIAVVLYNYVLYVKTVDDCLPDIYASPFQLGGIFQNIRSVHDSDDAHADSTYLLQT